MNTSRITKGLIVLGIVLAAATPSAFAKLSASGPTGSVSDSYQQSQWDAYEQLVHASVNANNGGTPVNPPANSPAQYAAPTPAQQQDSWSAYQHLVESSVNPNQPQSDSAQEAQWIEYQRLVQTSVNRTR